MNEIVIGAVASVLLATQAYGQTRSPPQDWAADKAQSEAETAAYNAATAAANARTAMIAAQTAADRAAIGTVTAQTGIAGDTTAPAGSAVPEGTLLVTRAVEAAAARMADALKSKISKNERVLVLTDLNQLSMNDAIQFDLQAAEVRVLLDVALEAGRAANAAPTVAPNRAGEDRMAMLGTVGAVLDAARGIGSFFQSNYSFLPVTPVTSPQLTASSAVAALEAVQADAVYIVPSYFIAANADPITTVLTPLQQDYGRVAAAGAAAKARAATLKAANSDPARVQLLEAADSASARAVAAYDALRTALGTASADQGTWAARILRQRQTQKELAAVTAPQILLVSRTETAAQYTRKNLWTFFGGPPMYTMGGVTLTYSLFDSRTGEVDASGVIAEHGGYRSVDDVEQLFAAAPPADSASSARRGGN